MALIIDVEPLMPRNCGCYYFDSQIFKKCLTREGFRDNILEHLRRGINSVVECHLAKVKVASSSLVSRST